MTTTTIAPPTADTPAPVRTDVLEIVVSLQDIQEGVQGDSRECAVAVALRRTGHINVHVSHAETHADGNLYATSNALHQWIDTFDHFRCLSQPERFLLVPR